MEVLVDGLIRFLSLGGPVVWLLGVFSIAALTVCFAKFWQFFRARPATRAMSPETRELLEGGVWTRAIQSLRARGGSLSASVLVRALDLFERPGLSADDIRSEATRIAREAINGLRGHLRLLEVIFTLSPLLGLFGTVLGMIEAFQAMEAAGSRVDPSTLSGGIWKALLTTAVGLAVAIPVMLAHNWFERKVEICADGMRDDLDQALALRAASGRSLVQDQVRRA